ncbi:MAG: tRNA (adenosine(37)-N6)-threonylcarbamoyltransferase complex dimerization subunit type 1 TsaB [Bacteroidetes bacterium]|uniref:tRNA (Adenosine(37)-N6)-threonylcarbamoyltransferase complex dimerization subunit type 1 TsaB n=1 Tax=Candidatus Cryptobacteroides merdavium TaxID=2840769 RepID=A0A9D9EE24_9BACT|nr:tRNA (adenosine(37)-N6)-threonylcarbamoyltransferase complex dimerization subunit type 1 TsaB [Candidatus Cryptobacteroides merdavium]
MERIILIETATALCSAALAEDGKIVSYRESAEPRSHASLTAVFIKEMLDGRDCGVKDCSAVCVSMGPGSYTGLRVGVSTAKGLCFGAGIPLLAVGTLDILAGQAVMEDMLPEGCRYIVPMIDARRMEVYTAVFTPDGKQITETAPLVVTEESFGQYLEEGPVLFVGDGAGKCADVIGHENAHFAQCCPKASAMAGAASAEYKEKRFKDVAYFEPFYLKEFVATTSKKKLF